MRLKERLRRFYCRSLKRRVLRLDAAFNRCSLLENVYNRRNCRRKALISYVTTPFTKGCGTGHTNCLECRTAAELLDRYGFQVDVIPLFASGRGLDLSSYDLVYGLGGPLLQALGRRNTRTVVYAPGCSSYFSRPATLRALRRFYDRYGIYALKSARLSEDFTEALFFADLIIHMGNEFVRKTYRMEGVDQDIASLDLFFFPVEGVRFEEKPFSEAKRNFLWFGSSGCVHKGLDILLEVFRKRRDINLYICGAKKKERDFYRVFEAELGNRLPNIHNMGFVDLQGAEFRWLMQHCGAVLFPSASEGGGAAILNVMGNGGLIPIVSRATGLDVEQYGFVFDSLDAHTVEKQIDRFLMLSNEETERLSRRVKEETTERYTYARYRNALEKILLARLDAWDRQGWIKPEGGRIEGKENVGRKESR